MNQDSKPKKPWYKKWWVIALLLMFFYGLGKMAMELPNSSTEAPQTATEAPKAAPTAMELGDEGYLRLSNTSDPSQVIILTESKESYDQVTKAYLANDIQGLLEIPGAFGVSNGTKVKLIDSGFAVRRVRIVSGVRDIDVDKVGRTGWVAKEFLTAE